MERKPFRLPHISIPKPNIHFQIPKTFGEFEKQMTVVLGIDVVLFLFYLVAATFGVGWLKVVMAILAITLSVLSLLLLFFKQEIRKSRSRWLVASFGAVIFCLLISLLFQYPRPAPKAVNQSGNSAISTPSDATGDSQQASLNPNDAAG